MRFFSNQSPFYKYILYNYTLKSHAVSISLEKNGVKYTIYSDSRNAMLWIANKKCKTKLERTGRNDEVFNLIERAERWLSTHSFRTKIVKWETKDWGEIPADFGRK